jgi:hypothetical protein
MNKIKQLQTELVKDLVKFEEYELSEEQLTIIEDTYEKVYIILSKAEKD